MNADQPKQILISGYYGFRNTGDEAILDAMIYQIKKKVENCRFIIISENPEETKKLHDVEAIYRLDYPKISQEVERSDLVILGGGGLFQDHNKIDISQLFATPGFGQARYADVPLLAAMHGRTLMFYSQGFGPLFSKESKTFVAYVCSLADIITTRDEASKVLLEEIGVNSNKIIVSIDSAFEIPLVNKERIREILIQEKVSLNKKIVCISVRQWIDKSIENKYIDIIANSLQDFLKINDVQLLFVPFQNFDQYNNDLTISARIIEKIDQKENCSLLSRLYHPREMAGIIGESELVLGMRYHSIIFAARYNVPFVALSYDSKIDNLMNELELEDLCFDILNGEANKLKEIVNRTWERRQDIKKIIDKSVKSLGSRNHNVSIVHSVLGGPNLEIINANLQTRILKKSHNQKLKDTVYRQAESLAFLHKQYQQYSSDKEIYIQQLRDQLRSLEKNNHNLQKQYEDVKKQYEYTHKQYEDTQKQYEETHKQYEDTQKQYEDVKKKYEDEQKQYKQSYEDALRQNNNLQETIRLREESLSWRLSQFYGKYFANSYLTQFISYILNNIVGTIKNKNDEIKIIEDEKYEQDLKDILKDHIGKINGIIIYPPTIDWDTPLFQRPHHLAINLSELGYIYFYCTENWGNDKIYGFSKIKNNCYITNQYNLLIKELSKFILILSSTNLTLDVINIKNFKDKALIIYEYIDQIHPEIHPNITSNTFDNIMQRHEFLIKNSDIVIATADKLFNEIKKIREKDVYLVSNGVDFEHFHIERNFENIPTDIRDIVENKNPIIGYYGALAKWFDYDLVKEIAKKRPNYNIVIIGWDYDNSFKCHNLEEFKNIHFLGPKKYEELPKYAIWFDVAFIPFILNDITEATSPIKIFEYMALRKPIVTTNLRECKKYKSIFIGNEDNFVEKINQALELKNNEEYLNLLDKEAKENTWESKAKKIDEAIKKIYDI